MKVTISLTGVDSLDRKLRELTSQTETRKSARGIVRKGTRMAAKVVQPAVERNILRDAYDTGELLGNVKVRALRRSRKRTGHTITTGWFTGETFYGGFQEWGWLRGKRGTANRKKVEGKFFAWHALADKHRRATLAFQATVKRELEQIWRERS